MVALPAAGSPGSGRGDGFALPPGARSSLLSASRSFHDLKALCWLRRKVALAASEPPRRGRVGELAPFHLELVLQLHLLGDDVLQQAGSELGLLAGLLLTEAGGPAGLPHAERPPGRRRRLDVRDLAVQLADHELQRSAGSLAGAHAQLPGARRAPRPQRAALEVQVGGPAVDAQRMVGEGGGGGAGAEAEGVEVGVRQAAEGAGRQVAHLLVGVVQFADGAGGAAGAAARLPGPAARLQARGDGDELFGVLAAGVLPEARRALRGRGDAEAHVAFMLGGVDCVALFPRGATLIYSPRGRFD